MLSLRYLTSRVVSDAAWAKPPMARVICWSATFCWGLGETVFEPVDLSDHSVLVEPDDFCPLYGAGIGFLVRSSIFLNSSLDLANLLASSCFLVVCFS